MGSQYFLSKEYKYNVLQAKLSGYLLPVTKISFVKSFPFLYALSIGKKKRKPSLKVPARTSRNGCFFIYTESGNAGCERAYPKEENTENFLFHLSRILLLY